MDIEALIAHRQYLHQHPETAFNEYHTRKYLMETIQQWNPVYMWEIAKTGLLVQACGKLKEPGILYRTDIDALPIEEQNQELSYQSSNKGVAHSCGHDGHCAVALGLVQKFCQEPMSEPVYILFQPAEETGMGAKAVVDNAIFNSISFNAALAIHNLPGKELNKIYFSKKSFSASVSTLVFKLTGVVSHAAEPENGNNPSYAFSEFLTWVYEKNKVHSPDGFRFATPVWLKVGSEAYGTNPGYGELHLTIRTARFKKFEGFRADLISQMEAIAERKGFTMEMEELEEFPSVKQDKGLLNKFEGFLNDKEIPFQMMEGPNKWGEDFGYISQKHPSIMFGVGAGTDQSPLHAANYNFPDALLEPTIQRIQQFIRSLNV